MGVSKNLECQLQVFACLKGRICRVVVLGISFFDATEDGLRENLCLKHPPQIRPS